MKFLWALIPLLFVGCSGLFLYPDHVDYFKDANEVIALRQGFIPITNGGHLHYWLVPAQIEKKVLPAKGLVVQVHGNAQNLSAHVRNAGWLTAAGYDLMIFDYEGFGQSSGKASVDRALEDVRLALDYAARELNSKRLPLYYYGQSLGGTLLLKALSSEPRRWHPTLIVIESSFYSFTQIGREKLALWWLTWPFQWLAYIVLSNRHGLSESELKSLAPTPVVLFYSVADPIVPLHNGEEIFASLQEPKKLYTYPERAHSSAMWMQNGRFRAVLLQAMEAAFIQ